MESAGSSQASGSSGGGGAKFGGLSQWQQEIESIAINNDDLNSLYTGALQDSKYDSCEEMSVSLHTVQQERLVGKSYSYKTFGNENLAKFSFGKSRNFLVYSNL